MKGTGKSDEVDHAVKQLKETLTYLDTEKFKADTKYVSNKDCYFAAIVGRPNKTLPKSTNQEEEKALCRALQRKSREKSSDIFSLLTYINIDKSVKKAFAKKESVYEIVCSAKKGAEVRYPEMFTCRFVNLNFQ